MALDQESYVQGLKDAIAECEAELMCVDIEYEDSLPLRLATRRAIVNCISLMHDKIEMVTKVKE